MEGIREKLAEIDDLIALNYNAVVTHPDLKGRLISYMTATKSCFTIYGYKNQGSFTNGTICSSKLQDVGSKHPISHL